MTEMDVRDRAYAGYNTSRVAALTPRTRQELAPRAPFLTRLIRRHFPADHSAVVLDIGCGYGALLFFAHRLGYHQLVGVDRSAEQVAAAHRLGVNGVHEGDALTALRSRANASVDVVASLDLIEHLTRDELAEMADEVHRVLRPGGRWILHTPNGESPFVGGVRYGDITHEMAFTRRSLAQCLALAGFHRVESFEDTPVVHGVVSAIRRALWTLIRNGYRLCLAVETGVARGHILSQNFVAVAHKDAHQ